MLSLRQIRQFLAVADTMNFRRAAERLNMAQPPLTAAIRQMEEALGVRLFERTNRITRLTLAGQVLREEGLRTIAQAERAVALTRRAGMGASGRARIGFVASAMSSLVPPLVARFRATHPDVMLDLTEAPTARQVTALLDNSLDLGVVVLPLPPHAEPYITTRTLLQSRLVAALPADHALARASRRGLSLAALAAEPWIMFPPGDGPGLHAAIAAACTRAGFTPEVVQRAVQMETILGLVAARLGVALVPAPYLKARRSGVIFRPVTGPGTPVPYEVALAWRRDETSPAVYAFLASSLASGTE